MNFLKIGEVAKQAQVNLQTVRYYERRGLIPEPPRTESGYRQYSVETVKRIQFIKHAQELGFSLKEITDLLSLRINPNATCDDVRRLAEAKIADIEVKIEALQRIKRVLSELVENCYQNVSTDECPILESLETE